MENKAVQAVATIKFDFHCKKIFNTRSRKTVTKKTFGEVLDKILKEVEK